MRAQPLIVCRDVEASSRFYQRLLGCKSAHGGREYERLVDPKLHASEYGSDGLIMQLHAWDVDHHHGNMGDSKVPVGNGVLLWFEVDDFDAAVARVRELDPTIVLDVHYTVVLASPDGEAAEK